MSRFLRVLIITGVPMGLLSWHFLTPYLEVNWADLAVAAVGPGLIFGLVLGAVAHFATRAKGGCGDLALLFVRMAFAAGVTAVLIFLAEDAIPHGRWVRAVDPPERVVEFAGPTCYYLGNETVYIKTEGGDMFSYRCPKGDLCRWDKERSITESDFPNPAWCERVKLYRPPSTPGAVAASYLVVANIVDCSRQMRYILLRDGSVWKWTTTECDFNRGIVIALFVIAGMFLSFLGCLSVLIFDKSGERSG